MASVDWSPVVSAENVNTAYDRFIGKIDAAMQVSTRIVRIENQPIQEIVSFRIFGLLCKKHGGTSSKTSKEELPPLSRKLKGKSIKPSGTDITTENLK